MPLSVENDKILQAAQGASLEFLKVTYE